MAKPTTPIYIRQNSPIRIGLNRHFIWKVIFSWHFYSEPQKKIIKFKSEKREFTPFFFYSDKWMIIRHANFLLNVGILEVPYTVPLRRGGRSSEPHSPHIFICKGWTYKKNILEGRGFWGGSDKKRRMWLGREIVLVGLPPFFKSAH